jgi:hypothetical protein
VLGGNGKSMGMVVLGGFNHRRNCKGLQTDFPRRTTRDRRRIITPM